MAHPRLQAVASLLHERAPRELAPPLPLPGLVPQELHPRVPEPVRALVPGEQALEPTHLLSNGRYTVTLRPGGAGWSRHGQTGITRWRDDALRDAHGSFLYLRRDAALPPVSLTSHPAPDPSAHYLAHFHADRVVFDASLGRSAREHHRLGQPGGRHRAAPGGACTTRATSPSSWS